MITDLGNIKEINERKKYLSTKIGKFFNEEIIPNIYFILTIILSSIESCDEIKFKRYIDWEKINMFKYFFCFAFPKYTRFISLSKYYQKRAKYERDFEKKYSKEEIEEINMKKLFYKTKTKNIVNSNINSIKDNEFIYQKNKISDFITCSENKKIGKEYYNKFLEILNNYSNDFQEDIEISIYDNLKETNKNSEKNLFTIKEIMNDFIIDVESKNGFLSLVRQSYLMGKLRTELVRILFIIFLFYRKMNL